MILFFHRDAVSEVPEDTMIRFCKLMGLGENVNEFRLSYGYVSEEPNEIAVLTGSIWDIMLNLAWQFDVPEEHVVSGRTAETFESERAEGIPPMQLKFSKEKPKDAFVAVFEQGYWFYIDQHDRVSKRAFSFLQLLLSLAETNVPSRAPLMTISN